MTIPQESGNSVLGSGDSPRGLSESQGLLFRNAYLFRRRGQFLRSPRPDEQIIDPSTNEQIGFAKDELGGKWFIFGGGLTEISIYDRQGHPPLLTIRREKERLFRAAKVSVTRGDGTLLGYFRGVAGAPAILDTGEQMVGKVGGWDERNPKPKLKFLDIPPENVFMHGRVIGTWQKYWKKDTTLTLNEEQPASFFERAMLLASRYAYDVFPKDNMAGSAD